MVLLEQHDQSSVLDTPTTVNPAVSVVVAEVDHVHPLDPADVVHVARRSENLAPGQVAIDEFDVVVRYDVDGNSVPRQTRWDPDQLVVTTDLVLAHDQCSVAGEDRCEAIPVTAIGRSRVALHQDAQILTVPLVRTGHEDRPTAERNAATISSSSDTSARWSTHHRWWKRKSVTPASARAGTPAIDAPTSTAPS